MVSYKNSFPGILIDVKFVERHLGGGGEKEVCEEIEWYLRMVGEDLRDTKYKHRL